MRGGETRLKWSDITLWVSLVLSAVIIVIRMWEFKKISPQNPNSSIERRLIFIELWIFAILLTNAIGKLSIVLCF